MNISYRRLYCLATLAALPIALPVGGGGASQTQQVQGESWYATHTFYGWYDCLAVPGNRALAENDRVLAFAPGRPARPATVGRILLTAEARKPFDNLGFSAVYGNETLWREIGCYWKLHGPDEPPRVAKLPEGSLDIGLALHDLPTSAIVLGGAATALTDPEVAEYLRPLQTLATAECAAEQTLYVGKRYGPVQGHQIVEFFVGAPQYADPDERSVIHSIQICKFFFHNRRPVERQEFSRSRDVQEHVDMEAPGLTVSNWTETPKQTLGFVSRDGGESWQLLTVDVGFEGIVSAIRTLGSGLPPEYEVYHYTPH